MVVVKVIYSLGIRSFFDDPSIASYGPSEYCTISIDSSVTRHRGYLTCRNMGTVTVSRRVLTKGQKM